MSAASDPSLLRRWRTIVIAAVVLAVVVTIGFSTGWLALADGHRPVGRLRPADIAVPGEASTSVPAGATTSTMRTTTTTNPIAGDATTLARTVTTAPDRPHGSADDDDGDGDDD